MLLGSEYEFAEDEHVHSLHCFENENPHSPADGCEANLNSVSKVIMSLSMLSLFMCRRVNVRNPNIPNVFIPIFYLFLVSKLNPFSF